MVLRMSGDKRMTKKIQTEFAKTVLQEARKQLKGWSKDRPKRCTAPKKCIFIGNLGSGVSGFFCVGFWNCKDEDIVRFCMHTVEKTFRMQATVQEASEIVDILNVPIRLALLFGVPDYDEVVTNFIEVRKEKKKEVRKYGNP